jgi:hypothetical protein
MKSRPVFTSDIPTLQAAIDADKFHPAGTWTVEHFRGFSEVFEDSRGIVVFVLYGPEPKGRLRISTMWCTPDENHRNGRAIIFLVRSAAERAHAAGFKELIFTTKHDKLRDFCIKALGFVGVGEDEYTLALEGR